MARERRPCYEFGPFRLDMAEHRLLRNGQPVPLTPKVFDVLSVLVQQSGHLVDKETLLKQVWADSFVEEGTLNRSVSVLRKTLGDSATGQRYIQTVPTLGYRFVAPVTECFTAHSTSVVEPAAGAAMDIGSARPARPRFVARRTAGIIAVLSMAAAIVWMILGPSGASRSEAGAVGPMHRQVTFAGREGSPSLSPDGRRLAYVSTGKTEKLLMVQELPEGRPLAVFAAPEIGHVRWSPDGSELMMWTRGSGRDGIYVMTLTGGAIRRIAPGEYMACWSPDGSTIAVGTYRGGKIVVLNRLGQQQRVVSLQGVHSSIGALDWSGDAGRLAFVTNDHQRRFTVWTIKPDGSDQKKVLTEDAEIPTARWAPRGDAIYFSRRLSQTFSFYRIPVRSGENRNAVAATLITGLEAESSFALSADGTRLAYARAPFHSNLWTLDAGRPNRSTQLTTGTSLIERPSVSPDGSSVVFNVGYEGRANLFVMPMTGGVPRQLTFLDSFNLEGVWSPDGKRIAFASTEGHTPRVWMVSAEGGTPRALAAGPLSDSFDLSWSPAARIHYQQPGNSNYYEP
jgi:Tol biopolymer transport system component/DNA-binding winged helix-turn-helix (wHTH) protein